MAANLAVADLAELHKSEYLWVVYEQSPFEEVAAALNARAKEITDEMAATQRRREREARENRLRVVPDGPARAERQGRNDNDDQEKGPKKAYSFWWKGLEYRLRPLEFRLLEALWDAPGHSLELIEVLVKVWDARRQPLSKTTFRRLAHAYLEPTWQSRRLA